MGRAARRKRDTRRMVLVGSAQRVPDQLCPKCGELVAGATGLDFKADPLAPPIKPYPGAITVCGFCGALMLFGADLRMREPSEAEMRAIRARDVWPEIERLQEGLRRDKPLERFREREGRA